MPTISRSGCRRAARFSPPTSSVGQQVGSLGNPQVEKAHQHARPPQRRLCRPRRKRSRGRGYGLTLVRTPDFDPALKLVNDHECGNGAAIFTRDGDSARAFANSAKAGMIGINVPIPVPMAFHSFGGWKRSLFGDHYVYGPEGVRFYSRLETITARWPTGIRKGADFHFPTLG